MAILGGGPAQPVYLAVPADVVAAITMSGFAYEDFGSANNLAAALNSEVVFVNNGGYSSLGFTLTIPTGATVQFEASFDGVTYDDITLRSVGADGYVKSTTISETFIGSIATARSFRARVIVAGSAAGTIRGRASRDASTLEGIEHGYAPHRIGFVGMHFDFSYTTQQTGVALWTPTSGKKFVVTDYTFSVEGSAIVTVFDQTDATGNRLFNAELKVTAGTSILIDHAYTLPFVSAATNNILRLTTSAAITIRGTIHGYEIQ